MSREIAIGEGGEGEDDLRSGLLTLVLALVEIVDDALEREAVRRMESGQLTDEEVDRLGRQLERLDAEIAALEEREGVSGEVQQLRDELNDVVDDAVTSMQREPGADDGPTVAAPTRPGTGADPDQGGSR